MGTVHQFPVQSKPTSSEPEQELFGRTDVRAGAVVSLQTFGSFAANFHPHVHALARPGTQRRSCGSGLTGP
jgi:hypothetical protein